LLQLYQHPRQIAEHLPVLRQMTRSMDDIRRQAEPVAALLANQLARIASVELIDCDSEIGSGALPNHRLPSVAIALRPLTSAAHQDAALQRLAHAFRNLPVPVIGRVHKGDFLLDCRALDDVTEFTAQLTALDPDP